MKNLLTAILAPNVAKQKLEEKRKESDLFYRYSKEIIDKFLAAIKLNEELQKIPMIVGGRGSNMSFSGLHKLEDECLEDDEDIYYISPFYSFPKNKKEI